MESSSVPSLLITHEIAHAVTTGDHGDRWVEKMNEVAVRAAEIGDLQLADNLREHITWVTGPHAYDLTEEEVVDEIINAADQPTATFEDVVGWVAQEYGQDLKTFLNTYPQVREAYQRASRPNVFDYRLGLAPSGGGW